MTSPSEANRHPADELADVRAEIKRLKAREAELRALLLRAGDVADLAGDEWRATMRSAWSTRLDLPAALARLGKALLPFVVKIDVKAARAALGDELAPYLRKVECRSIWLKAGW
jgi:hypothetical protein